MRHDQQHLEKIGALGADLIQVPLFRREIRGVTGLTKRPGVIYGDDDG